MSCERALDFDQWKTFSENYKTIRVWLWLVYEFTKNYIVHHDIFPSSFQLKRGILPLLAKYILTWKLLVISSYIFFMS